MFTIRSIAAVLLTAAALVTGASVATAATEQTGGTPLVVNDTPWGP